MYIMTIIYGQAVCNFISYILRYTNYSRVT